MIFSRTNGILNVNFHDINDALTQNVSYFLHYNGCEKLVIPYFLNKGTPLKKLVWAPGAIIRGNTVF